MKKILFISALAMLISNLSAQNVWVVDGAAVEITATASLSVRGGDYLNKPGGFCTNAGDIYVDGDWANQAANTALVVDSGKVHFDGTSQDIWGPSLSSFHILDLSPGTNTVNLHVGIEAAKPDGELTLGNRPFNLASNFCFVANQNTNAVTTTGGYIISETDGASGYGKLIWKIDAGVGIYVVPFGTATGDLLPLEFETTVAGVPAGIASFEFSTYPTNTTLVPNNRNLPLTVTHTTHNGAENAQNTLDRYWVIQPVNYATFPTANISFRYRDSEWDASGGSTNTITEALLSAQRWNPGLVNWDAPSGADDAVNNEVNTAGAADFGIFTLASLASPLPVELISFSARLLDDASVRTFWETASEFDNNYFTVQRSTDASHWTAVGMVDAKNLMHGSGYFFDDQAPLSGTSYYRLMQTDLDGSTDYSQVVAIEISNGNSFSYSVFPNPFDEYVQINLTGSRSEQLAIQLCDVSGRVLTSVSQSTASTGNIFEMPQQLAAGFYLLKLTDGEHGETIKLFHQPK